MSPSDSLAPSGGDRVVAVFGASGHTGRFVVAQLRERGLTVILCGRDRTKLAALSDALGGTTCRIAAIDDPMALDRALSGASAVINCAGPFLDTAAPLVEAALRARIHYLDVTAEQAAALAVFDRYGGEARQAGIILAPALAFYGGLADLLATAAMADWPEADEVQIAVALDSWQPTRGTRLTGERNSGPRFFLSSSELVILPDPLPTRVWHFPAPFGAQDVTALHLTETITIPRHLRVPEIRAWMNLAPLHDLSNPATPAPTAVDEHGRSAQLFLMDVSVRRGGETRRATATGRDIYAVTAPIVVEAASRILDGRVEGAGAFALGEMFDAGNFLDTLTPEHLKWSR